MADSGNNNSSSYNLEPPKQSMSNETRLLVTFVLIGAVLLVSQLIFKPPKPLKPTEKPKVTQQEAQKPGTPAATPAPAANAGEAGSAPAVAATTEQPLTIDTNLYHIEFTNRGATVRSWKLKKYQDSKNQQLELVNQAAVTAGLRPFEWKFTSSQPKIDLNQQLFTAAPTPDNLGVDFEYANNGLVAKKSFRFLRDSYASEVVTDVTQNGTGLPHLLVWRGGFGDPEVQNVAASQRSVYIDPAKSRPTQVTAKDAKDGPVTNIGAYPFAGLEDTFFAAVYLPKNNSSVTLETYNDPMPDKDKKEQPRVGAGVGGAAHNDLELFVGPKDTNLLRKISPKLDRIVDFGFFGIVAGPIFRAINWTNDNIAHNYGWAIILVTILLNMVVLLPFKIVSLNSGRKMAALQPKIAAINEKYKNVKMNDPRKQEQNEELMALYKDNGVNPAGGCVPMLLQIPFFYAFYQVLNIAIEMRGAHWFWVTDLSQPETLPIRILPVTMLLTQVLMQRLTPVTVADPAQQKMMYFMPLMMGYFFYWQPAGLVLYWLTGNLIGIIQQFFFNKLGLVGSKAVTVTEPPAPKKRSPGTKR